MNRWNDWWAQADSDLAHARHALADGDHDWAAFAAQQAAEKALKSLIMALGGEPWGHSLTHLCGALPAAISVPDEIVDCAKRLDKHYIPSRYPNGFDAGYPGELYTKGEAERAISDAESIAQFCRRHLP